MIKESILFIIMCFFRKVSHVGKDQTNSKEIVKNAGVSIGSFYTYYEDKKALTITSEQNYSNSIGFYDRKVILKNMMAKTTPETLGFKIKEFIDENYNKDLKLNDIAEKFYLSPFYLSHIFKKEIEFSPIEYLINRRIGEAQKLLLTTNMPICDISKQIGYDNVNYFNLAFKKVAGI